MVVRKVRQFALQDEMQSKPCKCGGTAEEVIGFDHKPEGGLIPVRRGWYCPSCHAWEKAILRETKVDENNE